MVATGGVFLAVNRSDSLGMKMIAAAAHRASTNPTATAARNPLLITGRLRSEASANSGAAVLRAVTPTVCTPPDPRNRGCRTLIRPRTVPVRPAGTMIEAAASRSVAPPAWVDSSWSARSSWLGLVTCTSTRRPNTAELMFGTIATAIRSLASTASTDSAIPITGGSDCRVVASTATTNG